MLKRLIVVSVLGMSCLSACGVPGTQAFNVAGGNVQAQASKRTAKKPARLVESLNAFTVREAQAAGGVTHHVELAYAVTSAGADRVDTVGRRLVGECARGAGTGLKLVSLVVYNSLDTRTYDMRGRRLPENEGLTLIRQGRLQSGPAPSALALDGELSQVMSKLTKGEAFLQGYRRATGGDLEMLQAFVKATQEALAGR